MTEISNEDLCSIINGTATESLKIESGDNILIVVNEEATAESAQDMINGLTERFPGAQFTVIQAESAGGQ